MIKKIQIASLIMLLMVLVVSCAPKPGPVAPTAPVAPVEAPAEATGEASIDDVAADISDTASIEEELDTSELDDIDSILADIENI